MTLEGDYLIDGSFELDPLSINAGKNFFFFALEALFFFSLLLLKKPTRKYQFNAFNVKLLEWEAFGFISKQSIQCLDSR